MAKTYAWSDIKGGTAKTPINIKRGEEVTQSKLGVEDAEWAELLRSGAIRPKPFPAPEDFDGSAVDFVRQQLQDATEMSSAMDEEEAASTLRDIEEAQQPEPIVPQEEEGSKK